VTIDYDGLSFRVSASSGAVLINNATPSAGYELLGSSVIVLGSGAPADRKSVTADVSHPEVTL
jgi:hypothetical protein